MSSWISSELVHVIAWFLRGIWHNTASDISKLSIISQAAKWRVIFGEFWNTKSGVYAKYPEETTMLLFIIFIMSLRNSNSDNLSAIVWKSKHNHNGCHGNEMPTCRCFNPSLFQNFLACIINLYSTTRNVSQHTLYDVQHIQINLALIQIIHFTATQMQYQI